ncbi:MAG: leucyl/phenylalanyl-tRNA--protein transferase [Alkalispirochaeta sp.]
MLSAVSVTSIILVLLWAVFILYSASVLFWIFEVAVLARGQTVSADELVYGQEDVQVRILTIGAEAVVQATVDSIPDGVTDVRVVAERDIEIDGATVHVVPEEFECEATHKGRALEWARRNVPCTREFVLYLDEFVVSSRLRRTVRNSRYTVTFDHDFDGVIQGCRTVRKRGDGTWITPEMYDAYRELHRLGYTHSVEVWDGSELVGGLYGLGIASFFAGESMFSRRRDASKFAFLALVGYFDSLGIPMIDCQSYTDYLASFGAVEIPRDRFLEEMTILRTTITPSLDWRATGEDRSDGRGFLERGIALGTRNRERLGRIGQ